MSDEPQTLPVDVAGVRFTVQVFPSPSGIRGKVWHRDEKIAAVRLFHDDNVDRLLELVRRDQAVQSAAQTLSTAAGQGASA